MTQVFILHGYTAHGGSHWFPWLEQQLTAKGIACQRLSVPHSHEPNPENWLAVLEQEAHIDADTIVIGHSLGCLTWLNFLARHQAQPRAAIFVSGFYQLLPTLPELRPFSELYHTLPALPPLKAYVIAAQDDRIVPEPYSDALAQHLQADYVRLHQGGHFLDREGWTTFPLVLHLIEQLLSD